MLKPTSLQFGTDPEGFFEDANTGKIIGSEKVLPEDGLTTSTYHVGVVIDGIQFELNPLPASSVLALGGTLTSCFTVLKGRLNQFPDVRVNLNGVVTVDQEELDSLGPKARLLGCQPSKNAYGARPILANPATYQKRSAGGHIHLGLTSTGLMGKGEERQSLVPILDIFVGNICVLLDRDPGAAERRENYGRAGEYRLPKHGLEYRTLSNFWLRNYSLMSFCFGMASVAVSVIHQSLQGEGYEQELIDTVNIENIVTAINGNHRELAKRNLHELMPFMRKHLPTAALGASGFPLNPENLQKFVDFTDVVAEKGLEYFFPIHALAHWGPAQARVEFATFLQNARIPS